MSKRPPKFEATVVDVELIPAKTTHNNVLQAVQYTGQNWPEIKKLSSPYEVAIASAAIDVGDWIIFRDHKIVDVRSDADYKANYRKTTPPADRPSDAQS